MGASGLISLFILDSLASVGSRVGTIFVFLHLYSLASVGSRGGEFITRTISVGIPSGH